MSPGGRGQRALHASGRALAPAVVFVATYVAVVRTGIADGDPLVGPEIPTLMSALTIFGWAIADGRRPASVPRPVQLWAAAVLMMAMSLAALFITFAAIATVSLGGNLSREDLLQPLVYGALSVIMVTCGGTVLSTVGVLLGRAWSRR